MNQKVIKKELYKALIKYSKIVDKLNKVLGIYVDTEGGFELRYQYNQLEIYFRNSCLIVIESEYLYYKQSTEKQIINYMLLELKKQYDRTSEDYKKLFEFKKSLEEDEK